MPDPSTMVDTPKAGGVGGCANGVALGAVLWNGIFLGSAACGLLPGEWAWFAIKTTYGLAGAWCLAMVGIGARW